MLGMSKTLAVGILGLTLFPAACGSSTPNAKPAATTAPVASTPSISTGPHPSSDPAGTSSGPPAPRCSFSRLRITAGPGQGAAGNFVFPIAFRNTGASVCSLYGYPAVFWVTTSEDQIGAPARQIHDPASPASVVNLSPGVSGYAEVLVPTSANQELAGCRSIQAAGIKVFPPGSTSSVLLTPSSSALDQRSLIYCNVAAGSGGVRPVKSRD
jgi:hypothetical protein